MLTILFNGTREYNTAILPAVQNMNGIHLIEYVLVPLTEVCYPEARKPHARRVMVHFGNAPIHNPEVVQEHLANLGFTRMDHPPYRPELAP
jgi:hypothetical protein